MYREIFPRWGPAPPRPRLTAGRVDVWRIDLAPTPDAAVHDAPVETGDPGRLGAQEALRDILGRYLDRPPSGLQLRKRPGGKPYLDGVDPAIDFNLSHCTDLALVAVATGVGVGIDVEATRRVDDPLRLARRMLATDEVVLLEALPPDRRVERFLDLWTRMEARQKAIGHGIFAAAADPADLTSITFRPAPGHWASLSLTPRGPQPDFRFFDYGRT